MSVCAESIGPDQSFEKPKDGEILLSLAESFSANLLSAPFNAGIIVANHGQGDRVGYADRGVWTGDPLPLPKTCPAIPDVPTCGGFCGGCPVGEICTGRSPLHPYGICVPETAGICSRVAGVNGDKCSVSDGCFIFSVEPEHQKVADATGFCLPLAECQAIAAKLPGGGRCE